MIRRPKRDLSRPQAPVPHGDWEMRWRSQWGRQRADAKGLTGMAAMNEHIKAIYSDEMPPGSPRKGRSLAGMIPSAHPLLDLLGGP
jgi:hypothetical protein